MADYTLEEAKYDLGAGQSGPSNIWNSQVIDWSKQGAESKTQGDRRAFGVVGDFNKLQQLHRAVNSGNHSRAVTILNQMKRSNWGALGTPYAQNLPDRLENEIQKTISAPRARLDHIIEMMEAAEGNVGDMQSALRQMYLEARDMLHMKAPHNARLTEVRPGIFQWTKWEDNPEWKAWREGRSAQRKEAARARQEQGRAPGSMPTLQSTGKYSQIQKLYAAHGEGTGPRPGGTEATKPRAVPFADTPGYIGKTAAAYTNPYPELDEY